MSIEIILGVGMFTAVILALVAFILAARSKLVSSGNVNIEINGENYHRSRGRQAVADPIGRRALFALGLWRWR